MALILVRGDNNSKLLNAIADIERHANLNLITKPKMIDSKFADKIVEKILKAPLRTKSNVATAFHIKEDVTLAIMQVKKIHPPAHVVVVSDEYDGFDELWRMKMISNKIWKIKDKEELYTDQELIEMIKNGSIDKDTLIATRDMRHHMKVSETIYQFYFKEGNKNEAI